MEGCWRCDGNRMDLRWERYSREEVVWESNKHGCQFQHVSDSNSASIKHLSFLLSITHSLITANPTTLNPRSIIHHLSSMATPNIELTQFPTSQFSQYSVDSPSCFTHLLFQSNDPVLKMTHAIGDTVQFETYSAPCIFLGTK